ncbi:hypothetical protein ABMA28_007418 [Loxostege sticticalis]|uniref:Uncharacterized protein n=1 Tax=Loxostege sticticalis TaxID=481309 RepID=A0ABD0TR03_LOXSC
MFPRSSSPRSSFRSSTIENEKNPKPFDVEKLNHTDFKRWYLLADKYFEGNLVGKISKIRVATFKKNRTSATVKYSMDPEAPVFRLEIASKTKLLDLQDCYLNVLPISELKHKDLMKLCTDKVIPQQFQAEYLNLTFSKRQKTVWPNLISKMREINSIKMMMLF